MKIRNANNQINSCTVYENNSALCMDPAILLYEGYLIESRSLAWTGQQRTTKKIVSGFALDYDREHWALRDSAGICLRD